MAFLRKPNIINFSYFPHSLIEGAPFEVSWHVHGAFWVFVKPLPGKVYRKGKFTSISDKKNASMKIVAVGFGGIVMEKLYLQITTVKKTSINVKPSSKILRKDDIKTELRYKKKTGPTNVNSKVKFSKPEIQFKINIFESLKQSLKNLLSDN